MNFWRLISINLVVVLLLLIVPGSKSLAQSGCSASINAVAVSFYQSLGGSLFWYVPGNPAREQLRKAVLAFVDSLPYIGLEVGQYDFPRGEGTGMTDIALQRQDMKFTSVLTELVDDIYRGRGISSFLGNDEVSSKYKAHADTVILTWLLGLSANVNFEKFVGKLEPTDSGYVRIKNELRKQWDAHDRAKYASVARYINFYRWVSHFQFDRHIIVNIPAARLTAYEHGKERLSMPVVVGKSSTRTPRMATWCDKVILYPYWNVPRSIALKELLPQFRRSPGKVAAMNMQILNGNGKPVNPSTLDWSSLSSNNFPYTIRQCTGCDNALGVIKFNLTDPFSVYMHDTNYKLAFGASARYLSHGCIRVSQPVDLGNFLLNNSIDSNFLSACYKEQEPVSLPLDKPVPVFVLYMTAELNGDSVWYFKDVYRLH